MTALKIVCGQRAVPVTQPKPVAYQSMEFVK
jgi:hypothetical protein